MRLSAASVLILSLWAPACGGSTPPPQSAPAPAPSPRSTAPSGPTRSDFQTLARKLVGRCAGGGWIPTWRSTHSDPETAARPRVRLTEFKNATGQDLDESYMRSVLEGRMQLSGVYDLAGSEAEAVDFLARGRITRLAERVRGIRIPIYTATLEIVEPATGRMVHRCEASVEGEMDS